MIKKSLFDVKNWANSLNTKWKNWSVFSSTVRFIRCIFSSKRIPWAKTFKRYDSRQLTTQWLRKSIVNCKSATHSCNTCFSLETFEFKIANFSLVCSVRRFHNYFKVCGISNSTEKFFCFIFFVTYWRHLSSTEGEAIDKNIDWNFPKFLTKIR